VRKLVMAQQYEIEQLKQLVQDILTTAAQATL
jgi:hypothetical protein